jgi:predicted Zn finger-like uncharacterized protein
MIISSCPHCGEQYLVSDNAIQPDATVQCPWCSEQFEFKDAVKSLPPALIVLSTDGAITTDGSMNAFDTESHSSQQSTGFDFSRLSDQVGLDPEDTNLSDPNAETYQAAETPDGMSEGWEISRSTPGSPPEFTQHRPQANRKSSGIGSFIGIILGGLLSLPLAGLILLALGKAPDLGFWPFLGNGSSVRSAAPLPPSDERDTLSGTPLRFNQPTDQSTDSDDPAEDALESILNSNDETSDSEADSQDTENESSETPDESSVEESEAETQADSDNS